MLSLGAFFDVEKLRLEAMARLAWWTEHLLLPYPSNVAIALSHGEDEYGIPEFKRNKIFKVLDMIYSNTSREDRSIIILEPIAHHLHWFLKQNDGNAMEKLADKYPELGYELAVAMQETLTVHRYTKQKYGRVQICPGSFSHTCKRLTGSKAVCDDCGMQLKHVGYKVRSECGACGKVPEWFAVVGGGCGEGKEVLDEAEWGPVRHGDG